MHYSKIREIHKIIDCKTFVIYSSGWVLPAGFHNIYNKIQDRVPGELAEASATATGSIV